MGVSLIFAISIRTSKKWFPSSLITLLSFLFPQNPNRCDIFAMSFLRGERLLEHERRWGRSQRSRRCETSFGAKVPPVRMRCGVDGFRLEERTKIRIYIIFILYLYLFIYYTHISYIYMICVYIYIYIYILIYLDMCLGTPWMATLVLVCACSSFAKGFVWKWCAPPCTPKLLF